MAGKLFFLESAFDKAVPIDGVFCMTAPGDLGDEEKQANALIDASLTHGIQHFVFASVHRGSAAARATDPNEIPLMGEYNIENHLQARCVHSLMT